MGRWGVLLCVHDSPKDGNKDVLEEACSIKRLETKLNGLLPIFKSFFRA